MFMLPYSSFRMGNRGRLGGSNNHILYILKNIKDEVELPFDKVENYLLFDLRILRFDRHKSSVSSLGVKRIRVNPISRLIDYNSLTPRRRLEISER